MGIKSIGLAALTLLLSTNINAALIVDPGSAPSGLTGVSLYNAQSLAGQFTTESAYTIDSIEGWIMSTEINKFGTIAIYSDAGGLPGIELFSSIFEGGGSEAQWLGVSGVNLNLTAGTYWAAFEVRAGQTMDATMPEPFTSPLLSYAYTKADGVWIESGTLDIGIRIEASVVPIPAAAWLFGSGLIGLVGFARRKA